MNRKTAASPDFTARREKLIRKFKSAGIQALLVSGLANVRYLTGFSGDSSWLFLSPQQSVLLSDTRYQTQLEAECPGLDLEIRDAGSTILDLAARIAGKCRVTRIGFEAEQLTVGQHGQLASRMSGHELLPTASLVESLREIKDAWETEQIRCALRCAERGFDVVRSALRPDQSETEIRFLLEESMRGFGASGTAFEPIVGVGPTAALPHARAGHRLVREAPVLLIDWGAAMESGYRCDLTRVLISGKPTRELRRVYNLVLAAQQAAIQAIRPGASCSDVDRIARGMIERGGFGSHFGHGLGHGFGLEIHESVRISPISTQTLAPGMVVTVEPGIYLPGRFGVRIEDDILVTRDGCERLSSLPCEFESACADILA